MQLVVLGLNHKTAPVEIRECFSFSEEKLAEALRKLKALQTVREGVLLSTCNRTEIYAVVEQPETALPLLQLFLQDAAGTHIHIDAHVYRLAGDDAVRHLFRVSSSLDSLVVGEGQILSQVKKAYTTAKEYGMTGTVLNPLFHQAIAVGKRVRTETRIAYNAVSVSYAAVELAKEKFGRLSECTILILGAGKMSELTAKYLVQNGVRTVFVSNRNYERAVELAAKFRGRAVPFEQFLDWAQYADIVITSTGAPHYIVHQRDVATLMARRAGKSIIFIDIAVPRDVEPLVAEIPGVALYNIDDLTAVVDSNLRERVQEAEKAQLIIEEEMAEFQNRLKFLSFRPTISLLVEKAEKMRQRELKKALVKIPHLRDADKRVLDNLTRSIVRKLLRDPIIKVQECAGTEGEHKYIEALRQLFKLEQ